MYRAEAGSATAATMMGHEMLGVDPRAVRQHIMRSFKMNGLYLKS